MSLHTIRSVTWDVLWEGEAASVRSAVEAAVRARANLAGADLAGANLAGANLAGADLAGANLAYANLCADLAGANLAYANLTCANFADANLTRANLAYANLTCANFADANLTCAKGIDYAVGGWVLKYSWDCVRRPGAPPRLRYGCETHDLDAWTPELLSMLAQRHESGDAERYLAATAALVAYCRSVDALHPVGEVAP